MSEKKAVVPGDDEHSGNGSPELSESENTHSFEHISFDEPSLSLNSKSDEETLELSEKIKFIVSEEDDEFLDATEGASCKSQYKDQMSELSRFNKQPRQFRLLAAAFPTFWQ